MAPENTDGAEAAAATPAADPGDAEQLQILIEGNQFEVPLAALEEVAPESSAPERATPRETDFSVLLATFDREDAAAEQFLGDALEYNPGNEFALLNLGVVYQDTGRPELARRTYAEIIRLNRLERAAQTVARRGQGVEPTALARVNFADLNLSPVAVESPAEPSPQTASTVRIESGNYAALYGDMSAIFNKLEALANSMQLMSDTLRGATEEAERQDALARAENSAGEAPSAVPDVAATEHREEAVEAGSVGETRHGQDIARR